MCDIDVNSPGAPKENLEGLTVINANANLIHEGIRIDCYTSGCLET